MNRRSVFGIMALSVAIAACHASFEKTALTEQKIYFTDRLFDVKALGPDHALVVGYRGKILETTDAGITFDIIESGTENAIYDLAVVGDKIWAAGQDGLILHSTDRGKTWSPQDSGTEYYLFSIFFLDEKRGVAVGDRSVFVLTLDGGKTWKPRTLKTEQQEEIDPDFALAMQDPVLYDVNFLNSRVGWVVGEFGRIVKTTDGGRTWNEQQGVLVGPHTGIVDPFDIPTFFGIYIIDENEAIVAGLEGKVARTRDGGANWTFEPMELEFPINDPLYFPYVLPDGSSWASGAAGEIVRLGPGEEKWKRAELGMPIYTWLRSIDFHDAKNGWMVGGYGTILRTEDGGESWRLCLG